MLKKIHFCLLLLFFLNCFAIAEKSIVDMASEMRRPHSRKTVRIPDVRGYQTIKCDFHIHTMFSDGVVWPTVRVREAWEEGLDVIAITDHIENNPSRQFVGGDDNSSYEIALPEAERMNLLLIRAGEISKSMPPGHLNALFLSDVNKLDLEDPDAAVDAALAQGAFIFWNHPGWEAQQPDDTIMFPIHERWLKEKKIHGMEVFNEKEWYPVALKWVLENDLAVLGNSDIHDVNEHYYDIVFSHRPMTLVFAEQKTEESIKEALFAGRSAAWWGKDVAGKVEYLEALFKQSVEVKKAHYVDDKGRASIEVCNSSDLTFVLEPLDESLDFGSFTLLPDGRQIIRIELTENPVTIPFKVANFHTGMNKNLTVEVTFSK
jgi:3',5'-nucleoside bisphosphate phosphatase